MTIGRIADAIIISAAIFFVLRGIFNWLYEEGLPRKKG
jgi:uncharacterized MAPEG superfamily protein